MGLLHVLGGHTGNLWTVPHQVHGMWGAAVHLKGTCMALKGSPHMAHTTAAVILCQVTKVSGMHMGQDTLNKMSASTLAFSAV